MSTVMSAQDKEWQAEDDARTLSQARIIYDDPGRLERAQQKAKEMAEEKKKEADAMGKVAGSKKMLQGSSGNSFKHKEIHKQRSGTIGGKVKVPGIGSHNVFKRI